MKALKYLHKAITGFRRECIPGDICSSAEDILEDWVRCWYPKQSSDLFSDQELEKGMIMLVTGFFIGAHVRTKISEQSKHWEAEVIQ